MIIIYKLIHPEKGVVYVGQTSKMSEFRNGKIKNFTIEEALKRRKQMRYSGPIQELKKECEIELIEITDDVSRERHWISFYGIDNLYNTKPGNGISKEERSEYLKNKYKESSEYKKKWFRDYYVRNREVILKDRKEHYRKNKEEGICQ